MGNKQAKGEEKDTQGRRGSAKKKDAPALIKSESIEWVTGQPSDITEEYDVEHHELGHGHYGVVRMGIHKATGQKVAVKTIPKYKVSRLQTLRNEISILEQLNHPNIIRLYKAYEDRRHLHLVMELCTGGELFDRIIEKGRYSEREAADLVTKILQAVDYCHSRNVAHRDLKPENFLFETPNEDSELKIVDFGLSRMYIDENDIMHTRVGTPYYIAPEVLSKKYDKKCDIWSIGVILYILLCGFPPFWGDEDREIFRRVRAANYSFDYPEWRSVSDKAKDLISKMLKKNPEERISAEEALNHQWITGDVQTIEPLSDDVINKLKRFNNTRKLKRVALSVMAQLMTPSEIKELEDAFHQFDADGNGKITANELAQTLQAQGKEHTQAEIENIMQELDIDGDGTIDYSEFLAATMERHMYIREEQLYEAFNRFDVDRSGVITLDNLKEVIGSQFDHEEIEKMISEVDKNQDGKIDYNEFLAMMRDDSNLSPKGQIKLFEGLVEDSKAEIED